MLGWAGQYLVIDNINLPEVLEESYDYIFGNHYQSSLLGHLHPINRQDDLIFCTH
jgi:hypothetical protein